ncbi:Programmed cell death toxin MazF [uncultured Candidatus Thioglobus sp.]|nr:Programmed cell death toxin MazF [uncultured Candidatus Thioglobus sp.]
MSWAPERQDIIWIDCSPQVGAEMKNIHPFVVLSGKKFNDKTSLVIGLPMTTASYNAKNPFAIKVGKVKTKTGEKQSYILCHQPKSFDWRVRNSSAHPLKKLANNQFVEMCNILNQIVEIG